MDPQRHHVLEPSLLRVDGTHFLREDVIGSREDVSHEGTVLNVLIITYDMHGIVPWFSWPVSNVTWPITFIVTLNFRLGRALDGETCDQQQLPQLTPMKAICTQQVIWLFYTAPETLPSWSPAPSHLPMILSSRWSAMTYQAFPPPCRWLLPQSQHSSPPYQSPDLDPRPSPSESPPPHSPEPQTDWKHIQESNVI